MKEKIKEIAKKWAFHLKESAISEESAIEEAITEALIEAKVFSSNAVLADSAKCVTCKMPTNGNNVSYCDECLLKDDASI